MPFGFAGRNALKLTHYINDSIQRPMGFTSYWEAQVPLSTMALLQDAVDTLHTTIASVWQPIANVNTRFEQTFATYRDPSRGLETVSSVPAIGGTIGDLGPAGENQGTLPRTVALLVQKKTGLVGRQHRGRMYIPGVDESVSDEGIIDPGMRATMIALGALFATDVTAPSAGILHGRHWNRKEGTFEVVISGRVRVVLATERKRQLKGPYAAFV